MSDITLSDGTTTVALNPDLYWSDENDYSPVQQAVDTSLTGAIIVQAAAMTNGQPITLEPADDSSGWMTYSVVEQLRNWAAVPGQILTLTVRSTPRQVMFRHQESSGALTVKPVVQFRDVDSGDFFLCTLRFMGV